MKRIAAFLMACILVLGLAACGQKAGGWQEQYDLGVKYLSDGNYEEAIIAFTAAIEIEPKRPELYLALADAYVGLGNLEMAMEIIAQGRGQCGDLDEFIVWEESHSEEEEPVDLLQAGITDDTPRADEVTFLGRSMEKFDIETVKSMMRNSGLELTEYDENDAWFVNGVQRERDASYFAYQPKDSEHVTGLSCSSWRERVPVGLRDVCTNDTMEEVFTKLGFTNGAEVADYYAEPLPMEREKPLGNSTTMQIYEAGGSWSTTDSGEMVYQLVHFNLYFDDAEDWSLMLGFSREESEDGVYHLTEYHVNVQ